MDNFVVLQSASILLREGVEAMLVIAAPDWKRALGINPTWEAVAATLLPPQAQ
jgi:hypothetical protein